MYKIIFWVSLAFICTVSCNHNPTNNHNFETKVIEYELASILPELEGDIDYTMNSEGNELYIITRSDFIKYDLLTTKISVTNPPKEVNENIGFNLVNSKGNIGVLIFEKTVKDNPQNKGIIFYTFDNSLVKTDRFEFKTLEDLKIIDSDFNYTSYFLDKKNMTVYFNSAFSYLKKNQNRTWSPEEEENTNIDLYSGKIYSSEIINNQSYIKEIEGSYMVRTDSLIRNRLSNFSIYKGIIAYNTNKNEINILDTKSGSRRTFGKKKLNSYNRFDTGIFSFDRESKKLRILNLN